GSVEASTLVIVDQRVDLAVRAHSGEAPVVSFAEDQPAAQVEGRAIAADRRPDKLRLFAGRQPEQLVPTKIDKKPVAVGMPQRAFGKDEAGGEAFGFSSFEHVGQIIGRLHGYSLAFSISHVQAALALS